MENLATGEKQLLTLHFFETPRSFHIFKFTPNPKDKIGWMEPGGFIQ